MYAFSSHSNAACGLYNVPAKSAPTADVSRHAACAKRKCAQEQTPALGVRGKYAPIGIGITRRAEKAAHLTIQSHAATVCRCNILIGNDASLGSLGHTLAHSHRLPAKLILVACKCSWIDNQDIRARGIRAEQSICLLCARARGYFPTEHKPKR